MVRRDPDATRRELLEAAFEEMYVHGFQAAGLDRILGRTGVTKGALYHHFANKQELGYAVVEEVIGPWMRSQWLARLAQSDDPVATILEVQREVMHEMDDHHFQQGCPINNLTQEMASVDEGFRVRLDGLMGEWRQGLSQALERGRAAGTVRSDVDPEATAAFLVASWEGMAGTGKTSCDRGLMRSMAGVMERFLEGLRPDEAAGRAGGEAAVRTPVVAGVGDPKGDPEGDGGGGT